MGVCVRVSLRDWFCVDVMKARSGVLFRSRERRDGSAARLALLGAPAVALPEGVAEGLLAALQEVAVLVFL